MKVHQFNALGAHDSLFENILFKNIMSKILLYPQGQIKTLNYLHKSLVKPHSAITITHFCRENCKNDQVFKLFFLKKPSSLEDNCKLKIWGWELDQVS